MKAFKQETHQEFQENMRRFDVFAWGKVMQDPFFCDIPAALQMVIQDELRFLFLKWRSLFEMTFIQA